MKKNILLVACIATLGITSVSSQSFAQTQVTKAVTSDKASDFDKKVPALPKFESKDLMEIAKQFRAIFVTYTPSLIAQDMGKIQEFQNKMAEIQPKMEALEGTMSEKDKASMEAYGKSLQEFMVAEAQAASK